MGLIAIIFLFAIFVAVIVGFIFFQKSFFKLIEEYFKKDEGEQK